MWGATAIPTRRNEFDETISGMTPTPDLRDHDLIYSRAATPVTKT